MQPGKPEAAAGVLYYTEAIAEYGSMKKILVIDDEAMILDAIKIIFEDMGYGVDVHSNSKQGLRLWKTSTTWYWLTSACPR
jgi:PleD family two-component response regulator